MMELIKGEIYTVWFNSRRYWADVGYIGKNRNGDLKMESTTYGDVYLVSKDLKTITVNEKIYDLDSIC